MSESKLKPCPMCGGEAKKWFCDATGRYSSNVKMNACGREMTHKYIRCERCGIRTKVYATDKGVFNAWNRRASDDKADS